MGSSSAYLDPLLFAVLPYMAFFTFFLGTIQRYRQRTFSYSSLSSQFLENQRHFWSLVPFHYGILVVIAGAAAYFFAVLESISLVVLLLTSYGIIAQLAPPVLAALFWRRATTPRRIWSR